jgi:hypothetical protein
MEILVCHKQVLKCLAVYEDLNDQEIVRFGISAPIADWGKSKAKRSVA